ncbi:PLASMODESMATA CALLOSE-BINDING PROTEIN 3-like protein [Drosera capensis]
MNPPKFTVHHPHPPPPLDFELTKFVLYLSPHMSPFPTNFFIRGTKLTSHTSLSIIPLLAASILLISSPSIRFLITQTTLSHFSNRSVEPCTNNDDCLALCYCSVVELHWRFNLFSSRKVACVLGVFGATYCLCNDGVPDTALQKTIDYACGSCADCSAILQIGSCYQPNTVKAHCDYAANSYYQRKGQVAGSCDFSGTATVSTSPPSTVIAGCTYPASPSQAGNSTMTPTLGTTTNGTSSTRSGSPSTTPGTASTTIPGVYGTNSGVAPGNYANSSSHHSAATALFILLTLLLFSLLLFRV